MCDRGCGKVLEESTLVGGCWVRLVFGFFKPVTTERGVKDKIKQSPEGARGPPWLLPWPQPPGF